MDFVGLHDVDIEHDHNYHLVHQESNIANHDHNYVMQQHIIVEVNEPEQLPDAAVDLVTPRTYTSVFGVKRGSAILRDSFGFLYYKNKITENKIYLVCYEKKLEGRCRAAAHVSHNQNDNRLCLSKAHNHIVRPFNLDVPMLREHITQMSMAKTMHPRNPRETYMDAIVKFPEAALQYTFVQSAERIRRMKSRSFPQTPQNMAHFHELLMTAGNEDFLGTLQNPPNRLYQGPLMVDHQICGTIFCNTTNVQLLENDLRHVRVAGCDGTFKTVPKFLHNDAYQMFTFQVIYQNVSFPLVHAILTGKTQDIYIAFMRYVKNTLPLAYNNLTIICDYELGLINAINIVFPESQHQGCYFHFCQAVIRYTGLKKSHIFNLFKTNDNAARVLRMILALPYLPAVRIGAAMPSMEDGFHEIVRYVNQFPDMSIQLNQFLMNYIWGYWFTTIGSAAISVFNKDIRTNNFLESYHATLLRLMKPHPKIWEFISRI